MLTISDRGPDGSDIHTRSMYMKIRRRYNCKRHFVRSIRSRSYREMAISAVGRVGSVTVLLKITINERTIASVASATREKPRKRRLEIIA